MATCKECLHNGVCGGFTPTDLDRDVFDYCREGRSDEIPNIEERCNCFKDKSLFIELPCKIGTTVYRVCKKKFDVDGYGMQWVEGWGIVTNNFHLGMFHEIGKTVFLTREEAESALAKMEDDHDR